MSNDLETLGVLRDTRLTIINVLRPLSHVERARVLRSVLAHLKITLMDVEMFGKARTSFGGSSHE